MRFVPAFAAAVALLLAGATPAAVPTPQQLSIDPFTNADGQHETAVEPDSFSFGNRVVAVFQVGRFVDGGASGIGFATSTDGGQTWSRGLLPVPGGLDLVSDPVIAYDRVHGVWVASLLAGRRRASDRQIVATSLLAARSADGLTWTTTVAAPEGPGYDKNWIACDNGTSSPRAGRCYVVWSAPQGERSRLGIQVSDDGGATWTPPRVVSDVPGFAAFPVVRPDGTLVVVSSTLGEGAAQLAAARSTDGGATFGAVVRVAALRARDIEGLRVPPLHSAEVGADGTIVVAWQDCRYRRGCSANDIVYATSRNGTTWTAPLRVPTGAARAGLDHVLPGLGVDVTTRAPRLRLALVFYVLSPRGCTSTDCRFQPFLVSSPDGGRSWSVAESLGAPAPASWFPRAGGRFAGDYLSTSFVEGGVAVPVFAWASGPFDGRFHQGVYATAVAPQAATPVVSIARPRLRASANRLELHARVTPAAGARVTCRVSVGGRALRLRSASVARGIARCVWSPTASGRAAGTIVLTAPEGRSTRSFAIRLTP